MKEIEKGSANVYADLGMTDAGEMLVKAQLATKIAEIIKHRRMTQVQAAELLGMPQPKLSNMLRGRFRGISEAKMLECLTRLGRDNGKGTGTFIHYFSLKQLRQLKFTGNNSWNCDVFIKGFPPQSITI